MNAVRTKRIYDEPSNDDGYRILIDRLWPRGITKERAALDLWLKEVAPSSALRVWFHERAITEGFDEFSARYTVELESNPAVETLRSLLTQYSRVTLLYGSHESERNHAQVLLDFLLNEQ